MTSRGLVIGEGIEVNGFRREVSVGPHHDNLRQNVRKWALFWDNLYIAISSNSITSDISMGDLQFLESEGILKIADVRHNGGDMAQTTHEVTLSLVYELERLEPGAWAIDLSPGSFYVPGHSFFPSQDTIERRGLVVKLSNAIPVPDREVPIVDILEFKEKRRPELAALRQELDDLYQRIGQSPDYSYAVNSGIDRITSSVDALIRVTRERRLPFRMATDAVSFNFAGAALGAVGSVLAQAPIALTMLNAIGAGLTVGVGLEWRKRSQAGSPYSYVSRYHEEVFGD